MAFPPSILTTLPLEPSSLNGRVRQLLKSTGIKNKAMGFRCHMTSLSSQLLRLAGSDLA